MELVFRVEKEGYGLYWLLDYSRYLHYRRDNFLFGFEYEHQLYSWFEPEAMEWLRDQGFKCFVYEADEYTMKTGKYQCAFDKTTATRIREIPL